jgi:hypothetical protein
MLGALIRLVATAPQLDSIGGFQIGYRLQPTGTTTTASFTVDLRVAPEQVGDPFAYRARPLPGNAFVGVRGARPPGGFVDHSCAVDATIGPGGSVAGRTVAPDGSPPRDGQDQAAPHEAGFYAARVSFGGTQLVRAGTDPSLILLRARRKWIEFVRPSEYPWC